MHYKNSHQKYIFRPACWLRLKISCFLLRPDFASIPSSIMLSLLVTTREIRIGWRSSEKLMSDYLLIFFLVSDSLAVYACIELWIELFREDISSSIWFNAFFIDSLSGWPSCVYFDNCCNYNNHHHYNRYIATEEALPRHPELKS